MPISQQCAGRCLDTARAGTARVMDAPLYTYVQHCLQDSVPWLADFYKRNHSNPLKSEAAVNNLLCPFW